LSGWGTALSDTSRSIARVIPDHAEPSAGLNVFAEFAGHWLLLSDYGIAARRCMVIAWTCILGLAAVDAVWLANSHMTFAAANWPSLLNSSFWIIFGCGCLAIVSKRLKNETDRTALLLKSVLQRIEIAWRGLLPSIVLMAALVTYSYLATAVSWPLRDDVLAAIDRGLGFDWLNFLSFTDSSVFAKPLVRAYESTDAVTTGVIVWLALCKRGERLAEFIAIVCVSVIGLSITMLAVPAAGAFAFYKPATQLFAHYAPSGEMWTFLREFMMLRDGSLSTINLATAQGVVNFPSFHTILAIVTVYPLRDTRWLMVPLILLNGTMMVATLPVGGHHLSDVLAGATIALSAIAFVRYVSGAKNAHVGVMGSPAEGRVGAG
jgi:membrane-associated phospholipid phosphatase